MMWRFAARCCRDIHLRVTKNVQPTRNVRRQAFIRLRLSSICPKVRDELPRNVMLLLTTVFAASMDAHDESPPNFTSTFESENVTPIQKVSDLEDMLSGAGDKLVVIFCMVRWCPFCRRIAPTVEEIAAKGSQDLVMLKLDMDDQEAESTQIVARYKAYNDHGRGRAAVGLPTFVFLRGGSKLEHFSGGDDARLRGTVRKYTQE